VRQNGQQIRSWWTCVGRMFAELYQKGCLILQLILDWIPVLPMS